MADADVKVEYGTILKISRAALILRGILFLLLGGFIFCKPETAILTAVIVLGIYVLLEGVSMLFSAFSAPKPLRTWLLVNAAALLLLGIFSVISPGLIGQSAILLFGIWQLLSGLQCLLVPVQNGKKRTGASALLSILTGILLILAPVIGLLAYAWLFATLSAVAGLVMLVTGLSIR